MTWGPTVISCEKKPNRTRRHDGWELSELTGRRRNIDRPPKKIASAWMGRRLPATLEADREGAVVVVPVLLVLRGLLLLPLLLGLLLMLSLLVAAQATHQAARSRPDGCALTGVSRDRAANGTNGRATCCTSQGATARALLLWGGPSPVARPWDQNRFAALTSCSTRIRPFAAVPGFALELDRP